MLDKSDEYVLWEADRADSVDDICEAERLAEIIVLPWLVTLKVVVSNIDRTTL